MAVIFTVFAKYSGPLPDVVFENCEYKNAGKTKMSLGSPLYKMEYTVLFLR